MTSPAQRLYELLPAIYRIRDAEQGLPVWGLLSVIADEVAVLEENLEQLYDDLFIETCAEWVIPYIGDLIGHRTIKGVASQVASARAEVANTIAYRRRKGTAAVLEQLARDVTDWNARAVEFFQLLSTTQYMNHIRPLHATWADLRAWEPLARVGTAFDSLSHTIDVRRIQTGRGRFNIPNVGIFLWRLDAFSNTGADGHRLDDQRYRFSTLGHDVPLFNRPVSEQRISHIATPINVPEALLRRAVAESLADYYDDDWEAESNEPREWRSFSVHLDGAYVPPEGVAICALTDLPDGSWAHIPSEGIAVDPMLGRIALSPALASGSPRVQVHYHHGFAGEIGGGEYERPQVGGAAVQTVHDGESIAAALSAVSDGAVEVVGSVRFVETPAITVGSQTHVTLRAGGEDRPHLQLDEAPDDVFEIRGDASSIASVDGFLVSHGLVTVPDDAGNALRELSISHTTLVPGRSLEADATPSAPGEPALTALVPNLEVEIESCVVGPILVSEGVSVTIRNSIVDATSTALLAIGATGTEPAGTVTIESSTIIGRIDVEEISLVSNSILLAESDDPNVPPVRSNRRQRGCIRYSYVPPGSQVPRRYECAPSAESADRAVAAEFTSLRYGEPGYAQLRSTVHDEIRRGADDESEMGAFRFLGAPHRENNVRVRLDEYLRVGLEAGIFYAT